MKRTTIISIILIITAAVLGIAVFSGAPQKAIMTAFGGGEADDGDGSDGIEISGYDDGSGDISGESIEDFELSSDDGSSDSYVGLDNEGDDSDGVTTITFTGDVELSSYVLANYDAAGIDGVVSEEILFVLKDSDILEINNEFPYSTRGEKAPDKQFTFRVDPSYVSVISDLGTDVAGLANNHVLDYGRDALSDTFSTLSDAGIPYIGAGNSVSEAASPVVIEKDGRSYAFIAASRVIPVASWNIENGSPGVFTCYDTTALISAIQSAKEQYDYVFVCVHWGVEHTDELTEYQTPNAHAYIDAGADAVIGAHAHCLQPIEIYKGKPIFYSLGNFIFNQSIERTAAVTISIDDSGICGIRLYPARATGAKTALLSGESANAVYDYLESISPTVSIDETGEVRERL